MNHILPIQQHKPVIGITIGDINGIGAEIILKTLADQRILEFCTPVVFGNAKVLNFYRKTIPDVQFSYTQLKDAKQPNPKQVNVVNCWDDDVAVTPGVLNDVGGKYAILSLEAAVASLKLNELHAIVTAPFHKKNVQSNSFNYTGHTPYLQHTFNAKGVLMLMVAHNLKVGLVTEHIPVKDVAQHLTKQLILDKIKLMHHSLRTDFGIDKPKIAVLGLNPHAGDDGLIGKEEADLIQPAIKEAKQQHILAIGTYSADAFFARGSYTHFDGVLAMYHDQGLIPFKSLAAGEGINYSAGLPIVRTSPDHGTAFDIAGKNCANHYSFMEALFAAIDIIKARNTYAELRANPLTKQSKRILANAVDERIEE